MTRVGSIQGLSRGRPGDYHLGFRVWDLGFKVWGLGFRVRGVGFGVWCLVFRV